MKTPSDFANQVRFVVAVDNVEGGVNVTFNDHGEMHYTGVDQNAIQPGTVLQFDVAGNFCSHPTSWLHTPKLDPDAEFCEYRSTKIVKACKFSGPAVKDGVRAIELQDGTQLTPPDDFFKRFGNLLSPENYIVEYAGGYLSVSPPDAFENGNVRNDNVERLLTQITDLLRSKLHEPGVTHVNVGTAVYHTDGNVLLLEQNTDAESFADGTLTQCTMQDADVDESAMDTWGVLQQVGEIQNAFVQCNRDTATTFRFVTEALSADGTALCSHVEVTSDDMTTDRLVVASQESLSAEEVASRSVHPDDVKEIMATAIASNFRLYAQKLQHEPFNPATVEMVSASVTDCNNDDSVHIVNLYPHFAAQLNIQPGEDFYLYVEGENPDIANCYALSLDADFGTCIFPDRSVVNENRTIRVIQTTDGVIGYKDIQLVALPVPAAEPVLIDVNAKHSPINDDLIVGMGPVVDGLGIDTDHPYKVQYVYKGVPTTVDVWNSKGYCIPLASNATNVESFTITYTYRNKTYTNVVRLNIIIEDDSELSVKKTTIMSDLSADGFNDLLDMGGSADEVTVTAPGQSTEDDNGNYVICEDGGALRTNSPTHSD